MKINITKFDLCVGIIALFDNFVTYIQPLKMYMMFRFSLVFLDKVTRI